MLVATPVITGFIFQLHQKIIRHQMKEELENKLLQTVIIQENEIHWLKAGKEIWLNNRLFDVKSSNYENGQYTFTGLYDEEETLLVTLLQKNQQRENASGNKILAQLLQLFPVNYERAEEGFLSFILISCQFPDPPFPLCSHYSSIITPPPQI